MFSRTAAFYDALYGEKDYEGEARRAMDVIERAAVRPVRTLVDVGCGTGGHVAHFAKRWRAEGVDLDEGLLEVARRKLPGIAFTRADMATLDLGRRFDAVTCLYGAIAYVRDASRMREAIRRMARHLEPNGVLLVDPWHLRGRYTGGLFVRHVDLLEVKIARVARVTVAVDRAMMDVEYLVATADGIEHLVERHELGLFSHEEHVEAFAEAGLDLAFDPQGLCGRGLYVGVLRARG